jgi:hypothetical protein
MRGERITPSRKSGCNCGLLTPVRNRVKMANKDQQFTSEIDKPQNEWGGEESCMGEIKRICRKRLSSAFKMR